MSVACFSFDWANLQCATVCEVLGLVCEMLGRLGLCAECWGYFVRCWRVASQVVHYRSYFIILVLWHKKYVQYVTLMEKYIIY